MPHPDRAYHGAPCHNEYSRSNLRPSHMPRCARPPWGRSVAVLALAIVPTLLVAACGEDRGDPPEHRPGVELAVGPIGDVAWLPSGVGLGYVRRGEDITRAEVARPETVETTVLAEGQHLDRGVFTDANGLAFYFVELDRLGDFAERRAQVLRATGLGEPVDTIIADLPHQPAAIAVSSDERRVAYVIEFDSLVVWEVATGTAWIQALEHSGHPMFSPDGSRVLVHPKGGTDRYSVVAVEEGVVASGILPNQQWLFGPPRYRWENGTPHALVVTDPAQGGQAYATNLLTGATTEYALGAAVEYAADGHGWSPDRTTLGTGTQYECVDQEYEIVEPATNCVLFVSYVETHRLSAGTTERHAQLVSEGPLSIDLVRFSPDGRWLAYKVYYEAWGHLHVVPLD